MERTYQVRYIIHEKDTNSKEKRFNLVKEFLTEYPCLCELKDIESYIKNYHVGSGFDKSINISVLEILMVF